MKENNKEISEEIFDKNTIYAIFFIINSDNQENNTIKKDVIKNILTKRQVEIVDKIIAGLTNKEIARELEISPSTVKNHISAIHSKLGVDRRMKIHTAILENIHVTV